MARGQPRFHRSTFFWGCGGAFLAIVVTVIAGMSKDIRWLLVFAWPFGAFAIWEFARTWSYRRKNLITGMTVAGTMVIGIALGWLYVWLTPSILSAPVPETPDRHLREDQKLALSQCIEKNASELVGMFVGAANDSESTQFGMEIMTLIKERTGLKLSNPDEVPVSERWPLTSYHGIYVSVSDIKEPSKGGAILLRCVDEAQMKSDYSQMGGTKWAPGPFGLSIAPK